MHREFRPESFFLCCVSCVYGQLCLKVNFLVVFQCSQNNDCVLHYTICPSDGFTFQDNCSLSNTAAFCIHSMLSGFVWTLSGGWGGLSTKVVSGKNNILAPQAKPQRPCPHNVKNILYLQTKNKNMHTPFLHHLMKIYLVSLRD